MTKEQMRPCQLLIVDDEEFLRNSIVRTLRGKGFEILQAADGRQALDMLKSNPQIEVILSDIKMPNMDGLKLLQAVKDFDPTIEVVMLTAYPSLDYAVEAVKKGAFDFIAKPFEGEKLEVVLRNACDKKRLVDRSNSLEKEVSSQYSFSSLVGASPGMHKIFNFIKDVSNFEANILITGESGTGKELAAKAIHYNSPRSARNMLSINCSALSESLLDSELFGHIKGAFTGAINNKKGLFESADRGTLFLDEIGDISQATQVKLLRAIEQGEIKPVGSNQPVFVDVRIIAATNKDLEKMVETGEFREDLYYRLNVLRIHMPALREREGDIRLLAEYFVEKMSKKLGIGLVEIAEDALKALEVAPWKGNVRELQNVIERAVILAKGKAISRENLPDSLFELSEPAPGSDSFISEIVDLNYKDAKQHTLDWFNRQFCGRLLKQANGNVSLAAKKAGMDRSNFWKIVKSADLDPDMYKYSN